MVARTRSKGTNSSSVKGEVNSTKPLIVVKSEPSEEGPSTSQGEPNTYVPAPGEVVCGYDEEPEVEEETQDEDVDVVNVTTDEQTTRDMIDPSPIERRLREKRNFNEGDWTSEELKALYEGITTYGTRQDALEVIQMNYCSKKTVGQVMAKVEEIREMIAENKEDRRTMQTEHWNRLGYRNVSAIPQYVMMPPIDNWEAAIQRVNRQIRSQNDYPLRLAIENALNNKPQDAGEPKVFKVTDSRVGRGYGKEQAVSWQRLGAFFSGVVEHARPLPPLNPLECAIALRIVDDIEDEVSRTLTDEHKAIIRGWLANIQMRNLRDFAPDTPYSTTSAATVLLDPLRSRLWNIPPDASQLPQVAEEEHIESLLD